MTSLKDCGVRLFSDKELKQELDFESFELSKDFIGDKSVHTLYLANQGMINLTDLTVKIELPKDNSKLQGDLNSLTFLGLIIS